MFVRKEIDETPNGDDCLRKQGTFKKLPVVASAPRIDQLLVDNIDRVYVALPTSTSSRAWLYYDLVRTPKRFDPMAKCISSVDDSRSRGGNQEADRKWRISSLSTSCAPTCLP